LDPKYVCSGVFYGTNATGTNGNWGPTQALTDPQTPDSWCFNIGEPFIQNYTTDSLSNLVKRPVFYLRVMYNGFYYNIINDPSVIWNYNAAVSPSTITSNGKNQSTCLYDIYSSIYNSDSDYNGLTLPSIIATGAKIYGILSSTYVTKSACNPNLSYKTDGTIGNPHELRVNLFNAIGESTETNGSITITGDGLTHGYITYNGPI
jgi:hypothetical protein